MMVLAVGVEDCGYVSMESCIAIYVVKVSFFSHGLCLQGGGDEPRKC